MRLLFILFILLFLNQSQAQVGTYMLDITENTAYSTDSTLSLDFKIIALDNTLGFNLEDVQITVFPGGSIANPRIEAPQPFDGAILDGASLHTYSTPTLQRSKDSIQYSFNLSSGNGYYIDANREVTIGTLTFDFEFDGITWCWYLTLVDNKTSITERYNNTSYATTFEPIGFGNDTYGICLIYLPVELSSFKAKSNTDCTIDLEWTTETEHNNAYFEILRSLDGQDFIPIKQIKSFGNSTTKQIYNFTDTSPYKKSTPIYYRLQQVDYNGNTQTFKTVSVKPDCYKQLTNWSLFPNPITKDQALQLYTPDLGSETILISIYNIHGQQVLQQAYKHQSKINIPTTLLPTGLYFLSIEGVEIIKPFTIQ